MYILHKLRMVMVILSSNLNSNCMIEVEAGNKGLQSGCIVNIIKF